MRKLYSFILIVAGCYALQVPAQDVGLEAKSIPAGNIPVSIRPGLLGDSGASAAGIQTDLTTLGDVMNSYVVVNNSVKCIFNSIGIDGRASYRGLGVDYDYVVTYDDGWVIDDFESGYRSTNPSSSMLVPTDGWIIGNIRFVSGTDALQQAQIDAIVTTNMTLVNDLGTSTTNAMSQNAVTTNLNLKLDATAVVQTTGTNTDKVISQDANTVILNGLQTQINSLGIFAVENYLSTNMVNFGYAPTNASYEMCTALTTGATSFIVSYDATGTYGYVAMCTNVLYYTNVAGAATMIDWSSENGAGSLTEKFELYAFEKGTTNAVEIGDVAVPQLVPAGATPTMRTFSIPYIAYGNTNGYYLGLRCKLTANTSGALSKTQWVGDGYNTHIQYSQPSTILTEQFAKTDGSNITEPDVFRTAIGAAGTNQITQTVTTNSAEIPSGAAVTKALTNKLDVTVCRRQNIQGYLLLSGSAAIVQPLFGETFYSFRHTATANSHVMNVPFGITNFVFGLQMGYSDPAITNTGVRVQVQYRTINSSKTAVRNSTLYDASLRPTNGATGSTTNAVFEITCAVPTNHWGESGGQLRISTTTPNSGGMSVYTTNGVNFVYHQADVPMLNY